MASTRVAVFLTLAACVSGSQYYRDHPPPPPHEVTYSTPGYSYSPPPPPPPPQYGPPPPAYNGAPKYKREAYPGDPYYGKPTRPDYGGESSSSSSGYDDKKSGYGDKGIYVDTSLYWNPTNFVEYVYTLKGKDGGTYEPSKPWKADCNGYSYGYKYGWITAIWDDYDFKGIDYLKCAGPKSDSEYDKYYERYGGYKLDLYDAKVIEFPGKDYKPDYKPDAYGKSSSYKPNECHKGYLLTALWSDYDFKTVKYGKCVRLDYGLVDYSTCDNIATDSKSGGTYEAGKRWNLECPVEWAAVGLKQGYDKIEYVRCCKLIPPHPPAKAYEQY